MKLRKMTISSLHKRFISWIVFIRLVISINCLLLLSSSLSNSLYTPNSSFLSYTLNSYSIPNSSHTRVSSFSRNTPCMIDLKIAGGVSGLKPVSS